MARNTTAKTEILRTLIESDIALSHGDIQERLAGLCDRVTIYRVLDRLVTEGTAHKIVHIDGVIRYAACHNCQATHHIHHHIHFNCDSCHSITCLENVKPQYHLPQGYKVNDAQFIISGICPNCQ